MLFSLCLIDRRVKTAGGPDGWGETFRNLIGVVMAALARLLYVYRPGRSLWFRLYYWVGTGAVLGFLLLLAPVFCPGEDRAGGRESYGYVTLCGVERDDLR